MCRSARFIFSSVLVSFCLFLLSVIPVGAQYQPQPSIQPQTPSINQPLASNTNPDVPKNLHTWTQTVMIEVLSALACQLSGVDPINSSQPCLGIDPVNKKIGYVQSNGGAIGFAGNMIASLYTPIIHGDEYVHYLSSNFGIAKPAYAQVTCANNGTGFCGLMPLLRLWTVFRDVVYNFFVLIFVVVGLAIMLRVKIDPRTVMSIENQIPRLIIGILLVTFSYAIAGFLIDFMWVSTYLSINLVGSASGVQLSNGTFHQSIDVGRVNKEINTPPFNFVNEIYKDLILRGNNPTDPNGSGGITAIAVKSAGSVQSIISNLFAPRTFKETFLTNQCAWWNFPCGAGTALSQLLGQLLSWVFAILAYFVVIVALFYALFRTWFHLLYAFISIMIDVIFAPFWIIAGVLPGGGLGFGAWIRSLMANLLAFPVVIIMYLLGKILMEAFAQPAPSYFIPPLIGNPGDPAIFGPLIGLGFVLYTPAVLKTLRGMFKTPALNIAPVGLAIGAGTTAAGAAVGGTIARLTKVDQSGEARGAIAKLFQEGHSGRGAGIFARGLMGTAGRTYLGLNRRVRDSYVPPPATTATPATPPPPTTP